MHNPTAGDESHTADSLQEMLREAGYEVRYQSTEEKWKAALNEPADIVVAAGGDGTVGKVAKKLAGTQTPLALLPIGMANNIAKTLGVIGDARATVESWRDGEATMFDLGVARAPWGEERFVESFGGGIFGTLVGSGRAVGDSSAILGRETDRALFVLQRLAREAEPSQWRVELDGRDLSGHYVGVEALNIRFAGPNVPLAPAADPCDGLLELVLIDSAGRDALLDYVTARIEDAAGQLPGLTVHQGRRIRFTAPAGAALHLDDDRWPGGGPDADGGRTTDIAVGVEPGAVKVLGDVSPGRRR
jgi:diacylglycerol kinase family enzyme